ncbi:hypothetical protein [Streptomyces sp. NPDC005548]|uniref:hypothetical protein n=1 Tax=Streptomyces sp. NPDC005548 TaxID=3364724 RepID=UPI003695B237
MPVRLPRKIRRILYALDLAGQPLTGAELCHVTCYGPGTMYPAIDQLRKAGWIALATDQRGGYQLTDLGRLHAGITPKATP